LFGWVKRRRTPKSPTVYQQVIGQLQCRSHVLLLADPAIFHTVRVEGIPTGIYPVHACSIRYPEGGERIAKIAIRFQPGDARERRRLGSIAVDSAMVVALDEQTFQAHWKEVGAERIGRTGVFYHRQVAKLISDKFELEWREIDSVSAEFSQPISEELEKRITDFLKTIPECADYPFMFFHVATGNSADRVFEAMRDRSWCEVVLDSASGAHLLAMSSGFGDGQYEVEGLYEGGELRSVEVEFIGPAQDRILDAFPILRY